MDNNSIFEKTIKYLSRFSYYKKTFIELNVIFILCYLSIFRANYHSSDVLLFENNYVLNNNFGNVLGIPINIYKIILWLSKAIDIIPICQLLSVLFISLSCIIIIYLFSKDKKVTFTKVVSSLIIGLTPSFLQIFSFRYNSLLFSFAIFISLFPLLLYTEKIQLFVFASIICNMLSFIVCIYMSNIFLIAVCFLTYYLYISGENNRKVFRLLLVSLATYIFSAIIYLLICCVSKFPTTLLHFGDDYIQYIQKININLISDIFTRIYKNLLFDFNISWRVLVLLVLLFFIINSILISKNNKFFTFLFSILILFIISIIQVGTLSYTSLTYIKYISPMYYYGYSISLAIMMLIIAEMENRYLIDKIVIFIFIWCLAIFSLSFGNMLYEQKRYDEFISNAIMEDLKEIKFVNNCDLNTLLLNGYSGHTPILEDKAKKYKVLYKIVSPLGLNSIREKIEDCYVKNRDISMVLYNNVYPGMNYTPFSHDDERKLNLKPYKNTVFYQIMTNNIDSLKIVFLHNLSWDDYHSLYY